MSRGDICRPKMYPGGIFRTEMSPGTHLCLKNVPQGHFWTPNVSPGHFSGVFEGSTKLSLTWEECNGSSDRVGCDRKDAVALCGVRQAFALNSQLHSCVLNAHSIHTQFTFDSHSITRNSHFVPFNSHSPCATSCVTPASARAARRDVFFQRLCVQ